MDMLPPPPLAGLRVLDLSRLLPGPLATRHLADLGAEVIKIEDLAAGDDARRLGPAPGVTLHAQVDRNKRALALDLKHPAGREAFLRLAETAEVIVEGFRPGVVDRLGIGYAAVRERNPRIVYCAITGYGQTGPYRERAGHDLNYLGYAGILEQTGTAGGPPAIPSLQVADLLGGTLSAVMGILAAVLDARARGEGRHVDVAMADCAAAHHVFPLLALAAGRPEARGAGLLTGGRPNYGVYETADGRFIAVAALEPKFWTALCAALGRPDLVPHAEGEGAAHARAELEAVFRSRSREAWTALLAPVDCCVSPVLSPLEALHDPQLAARGVFVEHDGRLSSAQPVKLSGHAFAVRRPAPGHGEHGAEVLREAGFDAAEIAALQTAGVVG